MNIDQGSTRRHLFIFTNAIFYPLWFHKTDSESDIDEFLDSIEDIPSYKEYSQEALAAMSIVSLQFGMTHSDFVSCLSTDQDAQDNLEKAKVIDMEKQRMAGKKSRRERRILKDERLKNRVIGPLSYVRHDADEILKDSGQY